MRGSVMSLRGSVPGFGASIWARSSARARSSSIMRQTSLLRPSIERSLENPPHHAAGIKVLLGQRSGLPAVPLVVRLEIGQCAHRFIHASKPEDALRLRQKPTRSRVLHDGGLAAREITGSSVAGPAVHELWAVRLDATELPFRSLKVGPV